MSKRANSEGSIYKDNRSGKWLAVVCIGYDSQGKIKRRQMSADTQKEALENLALLRMRYNGITDYRDIAFGAWLEWWLQRIKKPSVKASSFWQYEQALKKISCLSVMKKRLVNVTVLDIRSIIDTCNGNSSKNWYLIFLKSSLSSAVEHGIIKDNPANFVASFRNEKKELQILDAESFGEFYHVLDKRDFFAANACLCVWETGLRREEVYALRWSDFDFERRELKVCRAICKAEVYLVGAVKTRSSRRTIKFSRAYARDVKQFALRSGGIKPKNFVFSPDGSVVNLARESAKVSACSKVCGISCSFRALRHTHATILLQNGVDIKEVQARLGHKRSSTTLDYYVHFVPSRERSSTVFDSDLLRIV